MELIQLMAVTGCLRTGESLLLEVVVMVVRILFSQAQLISHSFAIIETGLTVFPPLDGRTQLLSPASPSFSPSPKSSP